MRFQTKNGVLIAQANGETLRIERGEKIPYVSAQRCFRNFPGKDWGADRSAGKNRGKKQSSLRSIIWKSTDRWEKEPAHRSPMEKSVL